MTMGDAEDQTNRDEMIIQIPLDKIKIEPIDKPADKPTQTKTKKWSPEETIIIDTSDEDDGE